jgi:hypothetical protein
MKLLGLGTAAILATSLIAGTASAGDWTGAYGGVQLGYSDVTTNGVLTLNGADATYGLGFGYDYDMGDWVIGGGLEYNWANINLGGGNTVDAIGRLKLRAGYDTGPGLLYATAGASRASVNTLGDDTGYFVGVGYEHMLGNQLSVGGELLYDAFDNFNGSGTNIEATTLQVGVKMRF